LKIDRIHVSLSPWEAAMRIAVAVLVLSGVVLAGAAALAQSPSQPAQTSVPGRPVVVFEPSATGGIRAVVEFPFNDERRQYVLEAASIRVENTDQGLEIAADGGTTVTLTTGKQLTLENARVLVAREGSGLPAVSMSGRPRTASGAATNPQ
jgi:hypothetical protein